MQVDRDATPVARPRRSRLDRSLRWVHAFILVSFAAVTWTLAPRDPLHGVLAVGEVAVGVSIVWHGERRLQVPATLALVLVASAPPFGGAGEVARGLAFAAALLSAMRTLPRKGYAATAATCLGVFAVAGSVEAPQSVVQSLFVYVMTVTNTYVAGRFVESLERSADRLDEVEASATAASLRAVRAEHQDRAVHAAVQVLHDEVLIALRAVEGHADLPAEAVREECRVAAAAVETVIGGADLACAEHTVAQPLAALLAALSDRTPIPFEVRYDFAGTLIELDPARVAAATRALREALRNAHRHAGVESVIVRIVSRPGRLALAVSDQGSGFADDAVEGTGISKSIRHAITLVGGTVQITSSRLGTTVEVIFEESAHARPTTTWLSRTYELTTSAGTERQLVRQTMVPLAAVWLPIGGWHAARSAHPAAGVILLVAISALPVAVVARLGRRAPTALWLAAFLLALSLLQVAGLLLTPDGGLLDLRSWSIGYLATPVIVVAFLIPPRWSLGIIGSQILILLTAVAIHPGLAAGTVPVSSLNALIASPVLTVLLGIALRRSSRGVERERARLIGLAAEQAQRQSMASIASMHLDHTRRVVIPWLRKIAEGHADLRSSAVRRQARRFAEETRDDLYAPGFHSSELRACVSDYRDRGGSVDIRPGFAPGAYRRVAGQLLEELVRQLPPVHRIRLSPPVHTDSSARLVITPPPVESIASSLETRADLRVDRDDVALVVQFKDDRL